MLKNIYIIVPTSYEPAKHDDKYIDVAIEYVVATSVDVCLAFS